VVACSGSDSVEIGGGGGGGYRIVAECVLGGAGRARENPVGGVRENTGPQRVLRRRQGCALGANRVMGARVPRMNPGGNSGVAGLGPDVHKVWGLAGWGGGGVVGVGSAWIR